MSAGAAARSFFHETLPAQLEATLAAQERAVAAAQRVLDDMRAVNATIRADLRGEASETFFLNVMAGRLTAEPTPRQPPFLTLVIEAGSFDAFLHELGGSLLGFLGALSGMQQELKLTRSRIDQLAGLSGTVRFVLRGPGGFELLVHFGHGEPAAEPTTSIAVERAAYAELRAGRLNPQDAFLGGQVQVEGDLQLAMQLALVAMSPE